jgi:hypothetical protein
MLNRKRRQIIQIPIPLNLFFLRRHPILLPLPLDLTLDGLVIGGHARPVDEGGKEAAATVGEVA